MRLMFQSVVQSSGALADLGCGIVFANLSYQIFQCSSYFGETKVHYCSCRFILHNPTVKWNKPAQTLPFDNKAEMRKRNKASSHFA